MNGWKRKIVRAVKRAKALLGMTEEKSCWRAITV